MYLLSISLSSYFSGWTVLPLIFFIVGIALLIVEMITPGLGAPGILGAISLIAAIVVQAHTFTDALITLLLALIILGVAAVIIFRSFDKGKISKTPIVLDDEAPAKATSRDDMIGKHGTVVNDLRPSGFAIIDGKKVDVVTSGEFITKDSEIVVIATEGQKIIVEKC